MHPNIIKMYKDRCEEFLVCLKKAIYPDAVLLKAVFACTDEPVKFADRLKLDYKEIKQGEVWGHEWQSAWFNFTAEVPHDFEGRELCLRIHTDGEALIFDNDGNPIYALTGFSVYDGNYYRDRYVIGQKSAGTELDYWVEGAANGLFGVFNPAGDVLVPANENGGLNPVMRRMELAVFNREVWSLMIDVTVIMSMMEAYTCENRRGMRMLYELNKVIDIYNFDPSNASEARRYIAEKVFSHKAASSAMTVTCIGHAHIDVAWLWPVRESIRKAARTFSTQLALMDKYPDYIFGASQAELYMMIKENYPTLFERIREKVKEGRWELQGGMWVEADCNLISGESMVRQFLYGKNFFMDEFGVDVCNLWIPDVFGYSASMPQIIKKSGCDYFLTQKLSWNRVNPFPHNTFRWRGIDGTEIITHFPPENTYNTLCTPQQRVKGENDFKENAYLDEYISLFGIGDGGGGPSDEYIERNERMKNWDGCPKARYGTAQEFFDHLTAHRDELPCWDGELYLEIHRGTLTTHGAVKKGNRDCEQALAALEFFASCGDLKDYPAEMLFNSYRDLLRNQFHDILPGSSITIVYDRTLKEYANILQKCKKEMDKIAAQLFEISENCCTVVNTLSVPWSGILKLPESWQGYEVEGAESVNENEMRISVPAASFTVLRKGAEKDFSKKILSDTVLENNFIRYEFANDGSLISIYDKELDHEFLNGRGNVMELCKDLPPMHDAWDIEIYYKRDALAPMQGRFIAGFADDVVSELNFEFKSEKSVIHQRIMLRPDSKRLDFVTHADWHENKVMLRTAFPTNIRGRAIYDIQYGQIERSANNNTPYDEAQFEVCGQRYADLSCHDYGMAMLNNCKYGYRIKDGNISMTLLRSPKHPDPEADMGRHEFTYSLLPHSGSLNESTVYAEASMLNRIPFIAENFAAPAALNVPCRIVADGVSLEIIKKAEKSNELIVRLVEYKGCFSNAELHFSSSISKVIYTDLVEWQRNETLKICSNTAKLQLKPYEIVTLALS